MAHKNKRVKLEMKIINIVQAADEVTRQRIQPWGKFYHWNRGEQSPDLRFNESCRAPIDTYAPQTFSASAPNWGRHFFGRVIDHA
jgi:hypothetical protein